MEKRLFILSFVMFFYSCLQNKPTVGEHGDVDEFKDYLKISYDSEQAKTFDQSGLIDTVIYLPLETRRDCEFSHIDQLEVSKSHFIILDKGANEIFFYDKKGRFVNKISPYNKDIPTPYQAIQRISIDKKKGVLAFNDIHSDKIYEFDLDAKFLNQRTRTISDDNKNDFHVFDHNEISLNYFYSAAVEKQDQLPAITVKNNSNNNTFNYLYYNPNIIDHEDFIGLNKYFYDSNLNYLLIAKPYDYTIYRYDTKNILTKYFTLELPAERSLPEDFISSEFYSAKRIKYLKGNHAVIYSIADIYEAGNWMSLRTYSTGNITNYLYYKTNKKLLDLNYIVSTNRTYFLPIIGREILGVDRDYFVSTVPCALLIKFITEEIGKKDYWNSLPESLKAIYKAGNDQNNILLLTKLKS